MNENKLNEVIKNAPLKRGTLKRRLEGNNGNDMLVSHEDIALAFPSSNPHPTRFEIPEIDEDALNDWAVKQGWNVQPAPEKSEDEAVTLFQIRFTKIK